MQTNWSGSYEIADGFLLHFNTVMSRNCYPIQLRWALISYWIRANQLTAVVSEILITKTSPPFILPGSAFRFPSSTASHSLWKPVTSQYFMPTDLITWTTALLQPLSERGPRRQISSANYLNQTEAACCGSIILRGRAKTVSRLGNRPILTPDCHSLKSISKKYLLHFTGGGDLHQSKSV